MIQFIECKNFEQNQKFSMIFFVNPSHLLINQSEESNCSVSTEVLWRGRKIKLLSKWKRKTR